MSVNLELLTQAALAQGACGRPALPDGTRVLELPAAFYFQRYVNTAGPLVDTAYQVFDKEFQFVLRSIQYRSGLSLVAPGLAATLRFSNGRILTLPTLNQSVLNGMPARIDFTGTSSQDSAGGIVIGACERVTVESVGYPLPFPDSLTGFVVDTEILFVGVLRVFLKGNGTQLPMPTPAGGPRALFTANQNLFEPEVLRGFQCYPETPAGYRDEPFWIQAAPVTVAVNAGPPVNSTVASGQVLVPGDADFVWREWSFLVGEADPTVTTPITVAVQFRTMNGESLSDDLVDCASCQGPVFPELRLPRGSYLFYDVTVTNPGGLGNVQVSFTLYGVRRFHV